MRIPQSGEVWLADLGLAAKTRPVLIVSVEPSEEEYALVSVVPHTTQSRETRFSMSVRARFLEPGMFNVQGMLAVPTAKCLRLLGTLSKEEMAGIELFCAAGSSFEDSGCESF